MVKQINSITPKQLKQLQQALMLIKNAFDLTDEQIDSFIALLQHAKQFTELIQATDKRLSSIEQTISKQSNESMAQKAKEMYDYLNTPVKSIKI